MPPRLQNVVQFPARRDPQGGIPAVFALSPRRWRPIAIALALSAAIHLAGAAWIGRWFPGETAAMASAPLLLEVSVTAARDSAASITASAAQTTPRPKSPQWVQKPPSATGAPAVETVASALVKAPDSTASAAPEKTDASATVAASSTDAGKPAGPWLQAGYLHTPLPPYPPSARRLAQEGVALARVYVGEDGRPVEVRLARSSGFAALDEAALGAVRGWRFFPARRGAEPVASWIEVPLRFRLDAAGQK